MYVRCFLLAFLFAVGACTATPALKAAGASEAIPACPADASPMDGWSDRAPPRHIFGNTWYIGTCGISSILVASEQGHVLIDGATEAAGPLIEANIRALGFDPHEVKAILNTHDHFDHAAGIAYLQRVTGAGVHAREPAIATLQRGRSDRDDPQFDDLPAFPSVADVRAIADGEILRVGGLALTAHATPGHTPGGTSWSWRSCENGRCLDIAYADSLSAISDRQYRYGTTPGAADAFRRTFDTVATLPCDILLTPHPVASNLFARLDGKAPLVDGGACRRYAGDARAKLEQRLKDEKNGTAP